MERGSEQASPPHPPSSLLLYRLYSAYLLSRWANRMWEFAVGLYMIHVWPNSLLLAAIYGVTESACTALFGPVVGQWVDKLTYRKVLQLWLASQNLSFIVAGGAMMSLLTFSSMKSTNFVAFISLVALTNISGAVGVLSALAGTILIEREWVVVISAGHHPRLLTKMNSVIRRIDLICKLLAPVITGFIISFISLKASAMTLALWTTVTVWMEYWLFTSVHNGIPALGERSQGRQFRSSQTDAQDNASTIPANNNLVSSSEATTIPVRRSRVSKMMRWISKVPFVVAWKVYLQQDVLLAGVALALLYFTVLSFGTLMTATLEWEGIHTYVIGIARGVSATIGIGATVLYPVLHSRISALRTGLWSIWSQWSCLLVCVGSIWVKHKYLSAYMLMGGAAASRLGLWMFDLAVIQQMQDHVPESNRGVVGGVQNSLQSTLDLMGYVMGIVISNPKEFWKLNLISVGAVTVAALLYNLHLCKMRGHLFHLDKLLCKFKSNAR